MTTILMTTSAQGDAWTFSMELCAALRPYGVNIALATLGSALSPDQRSQLAGHSHVQLHESTCRSYGMDDTWDQFEDAENWLLDLEREIQPDIIHLNDLIHGGLPWRTPVLLVVHSCFLSWWQAVKKQPPPSAQRQRYNDLVKHSVQRATMVVAPSTAMLAKLYSTYGSIPEGTVIVNGRSFPGLLPAPELKVPVMEPLVFSSGSTWDEAKNIGALAGIADKIPWRICVAGAADRITDSAPANFRTLGPLSDDKLALWLARASIYAAPVHYEPYGFAMIEAARAGCALVLGNVDSLRELWGDAAEYVDPDDPDDLLRTINHLIDRPQRLREMMERAWRRAQRYSGSRMAAGYMHCYRLLQETHVPVLHPEWQIHERPLTGIQP